MELAASGQHRLPAVILEHRSLTKLHSFFAQLKLQHAEAGAPPGGGSLRRIRGSFNQTTTETGEERQRTEYLFLVDTFTGWLM